jgi:anaphase-promoting complex subunit 8
MLQKSYRYIPLNILFYPLVTQDFPPALEMNMRDFRAWYGLGQAYEILKMPLYSLYYYRMAQSLKPDDSRMLVALGDAYDKLDRLHDAKKCYWKAHCVGDLECIALLRLAK